MLSAGLGGAGRLAASGRSPGASIVMFGRIFEPGRHVPRALAQQRQQRRHKVILTISASQRIAMPSRIRTPSRPGRA